MKRGLCREIELHLVLGLTRGQIRGVFVRERCTTSHLKLLFAYSTYSSFHSLSLSLSLSLLPLSFLSLPCYTQAQSAAVGHDQVLPCTVKRFHNTLSAHMSAQVRMLRYTDPFIDGLNVLMPRPFHRAARPRVACWRSQSHALI